MSKKSIGIFLLLCTLLLLTAPGTAAQHTRPDSILRAESFYFKGRLGLNFYGGDRDINPGDEFQKYIENIGFSFGLESGYSFTDRFSLGLMYLAGTYPRIEDIENDLGRPFSQPAYGFLDQSTTSTWRHHFAVIGRSYWYPSGTISPYGHMGFHLSFGKINGKTRTGVGPVAGIGLDYWISDRWGLFLELTGLFAFDDEALDLADTKAKGTLNSSRGIDASDFDSFTFFGFGLRYTMDSQPSVPFQVLCAGPDSLFKNVDGRFFARIKKGAKAKRPITYEWDFGDGTPKDTGALTTHAFEQPDTMFTVTVTAKDRKNTDTDECRVYVKCKAVDLKEIFFKRNTSDPDSTRGLVETLEANAETVNTILDKCPNTPVVIEVYASCSECASPDECEGRDWKQLSEDRASEIEQFYTDRGIPQKNIKIIPAETCDDS